MGLTFEGRFLVLLLNYAELNILVIDPLSKKQHVVSLHDTNFDTSSYSRLSKTQTLYNPSTTTLYLLVNDTILEVAMKTILKKFIGTCLSSMQIE